LRGSTKEPGDSIGTEVNSLGEGGSDDNSDGPTVLQSNPPLSGKVLIYQQYLESKQNDSTLKVPGDKVVTDVISPGGGGSHDKSDGPIQYYQLILHYVGIHYYINNIWRKERVESTGLENYHLASPHNVSITMFSPCICATSFQITFIF
jgi:hypothetical protein